MEKSTDTECAKEGCTLIGRMRCGRCQSVKYCSAACQKAAWLSHKVVCVPVKTESSADEGSLKPSADEGSLKPALGKAVITENPTPTVPATSGSSSLKAAAPAFLAAEEAEAAAEAAAQAAAEARAGAAAEEVAAAAGDGGEEDAPAWLRAGATAPVQPSVGAPAEAAVEAEFAAGTGAEVVAAA